MISISIVIFNKMIIMIIIIIIIIIIIHNQVGDYMGEGDEWNKSVLYAYVDQVARPYYIYI